MSSIHLPPRIDKFLSILKVNLPSKISESAQSSTRTDDEQQQVAQMMLMSSTDFLVGFIHSVMVHLGFRLVGLGEEGNDLQGTTTLIEGWNQSHEMYALRYRHDQSSMTFLIKCMKMMNKLMIHGVAVEDNKIHSIEIPNIQDIISQHSTKKNKDSSDNSTITTGGSSSKTTPSAQERESETSHDQSVLSRINAVALDELLVKFYQEIVDPLLPGVTKEGFERLTRSAATQTSERNSYPHDPLRESRSPRPSFPQRGIFQEGEEGSYFGSGAGIRDPFSVGRSDLDPFAAAPGIVGPGGIRLPGNYGGGMVVGPEHPMFRPPSGVPFGSGSGPFIPGSRLPPGAIPPGARFDPITPFGPRPGFPPRPGRPTPGRGIGPFSNLPFSGEPDNDELPPPGYDNMFM